MTQNAVFDENVRSNSSIMSSAASTFTQRDSVKIIVMWSRNDPGRAVLCSRS